ncbi:MAG: hypothetical protein UX76_C0019G0040 [Candidatus Wolfebacteria bacterium GW2011_GWC1_47_103]|nr:MAG: hypothetical protein UX76_C0019G0040 [Candidatus Wolfebacteria bacterium GW2011_GWC1_47_103]
MGVKIGVQIDALIMQKQIGSRSKLLPNLLVGMIGHGQRLMSMPAQARVPLKDGRLTERVLLILLILPAMTRMFSIQMVLVAAVEKASRLMLNQLAAMAIGRADLLICP